MTSAVAPVNFTFEGTDVTDFDGIFLCRFIRGGPGSPAEVAGRDDEVPGAVGMFVRNRIKRRRVIEIGGFIRGISSDEASDRDDYWTNREAFEALFDPTVYGVLTADTGGLAFSINARPLPGDPYAEELPSYATVSISLESVDPDWTGGAIGS